MLSTEDQMIVALRRISQAVDQYSRKLWQEFGLTVPQLAILREVLRAENVSPGTLAKAMHLSQPTVTGILTRLEASGLIVRRRSDIDRRIVIAVATDEGKRVADAAPPLLRDRFRKELKLLPEWQQTDLLAALQRVAMMMQAPDADLPPLLYLEGADVVENANGSPGRVPKRRQSASAKIASDQENTNGVIPT